MGKMRKKIRALERKEKLYHKYIRPFEVLEEVETVAYKLALPLDFSGVHPVFHMSMLRKYVAHPSHVIES